MRMITAVLISFAASSTVFAGKKEFQDADRRMNAVYSQLMEQLPEDSQVQLRVAQRKWIAFRDSACAFEQTNFGLMTSTEDCKVALSVTRTSDLQMQIGWLAHDAADLPLSKNLPAGSCLQSDDTKVAKSLVQKCLRMNMLE